MTRRGRQIPNIAVLTALCLAPAAYAADAQTTRDTVTAPSYTAAGLVNAATGLSGALAPNAIVSLYGTNLSFRTASATGADMKSGELPSSLGGVNVYVGHIAAGIFFVSPTQINFVVPYELRATSTTFSIVRQNLAGQVLTVPVAPVAPAFFQWNGNHAIAEHADGSLISPDSPAENGEIIVLYANGLGRTMPDLIPGYVSGVAVPILAAAQLRIIVAGSPCASSSILYAGVTPGYAGLYQINVRLPETVPPDAEIRVSIGSAISPAGIQLYSR